jgi:glycosyltransferase involved in cell wall biosynthesis
MHRATTSIAMCTFNGSKYLREQLDSIASQTVVPDEMVICDDLSNDDTGQILKEFTERVPFPVRVFINETRLGPARNFEKAIQCSDGEIIFLCDQDDVWKSGKVEQLCTALSHNPGAVFAFSNADMVNESGLSLGGTLWDAVGLKDQSNLTGPGLIETLLKFNRIAGAAMAIRASFRDIFLPIPDGWMHDYWIVLLGATLASGVPVSEPLFKYRRHAAQALGWRKRTFFQVLQTSLETNEEVLRSKVNNFQKFRERFAAAGGMESSSQECRDLIHQKEVHLQKRAVIRSSGGLARLTKVMAEAFTGRYQRYSNSWYSIFRDLLMNKASAS